MEEKIKIRFSINLSDKFDPNKGSDFITKIKELRLILKKEENIDLPKIRIMDTKELENNCFEILINNEIKFSSTIKNNTDEIIPILKKYVIENKNKL